MFWNLATQHNHHPHLKDEVSAGRHVPGEGRHPPPPTQPIATHGKREKHEPLQTATGAGSASKKAMPFFREKTPGGSNPAPLDPGLFVVVHNGRSRLRRNNEKPCTGGSESERSYRWPSRPASQELFSEEDLRRLLGDVRWDDQDVPVDG